MNIEDDKRDKDGIAPDDVSFYTADSRRLNTYENAERRLSQFQAPMFVSQSNPHARLYLPAFDGTGNDKFKDPLHETNVGKIDDQIQKARNPRIQSGYVPGPGTEDGWLARTRDGATGGTYEPRLEEMYMKLIRQARDWKQQDPQAVISVADMGFSRGASQAAGFARMVEERGIQDPAAVHYTRDASGLIVGVTFDKNIPPLVPPGHVAQAEMLFDPVSTGTPMDYDRRPPPSVISGLQILAEDEKRPAFKSDHIIDPGLSPDGRFLGVTVAGAHSDIGGGYHRDGLARRSENIAINYLNALSDTPFLQNVPEPTDPRLNVVHRSEQGFPFDIDPRPHVNRDLPQGYNERLVPQEVHTRFMYTPYGPVATETRSERPGVLDPSNAEYDSEWRKIRFAPPFRSAYSPSNGLFETGESDVSRVPFPPRGCIQRRSFSTDDRMPSRHVHAAG